MLDDPEFQTRDELVQRVRQLEFRVEKMQQESATPAAVPVRSVRRRSSTRILGMPLYDIAVGPDPSRGETRGHARGFIAIGDIATGIVSIGGISRGVISIGGVAVGIFSLGGVAFGLAAALAGAAVGGLAMGGAAVGGVAIGGAAVGYYAVGGAAAGVHVVDAMRRDPVAVRFFAEWLPWLRLP